MSIKQHVMGNASFQYYRQGNLYYKTDSGLEFAVPVSDTNDASFNRDDKAIFFMRWIRKHLENMADTNVEFSETVADTVNYHE